MEQLFFGLAVLACPVGMGAMMWMMMRGQKKNTDPSSEQPDHTAAQELAHLQAEVEQLKSQRASRAQEESGR
ncbi:hypothetical protein [Segeticoccus rhizosphaerae]|uniref:hypothetical protein n=1 Tax=Segeticoccus rhizosphaerae TaxID=1104777 RepID=UPI0010BFF248|nr:hypothetical protein [Ornithinicoccus soli]